MPLVYSDYDLGAYFNGLEKYFEDGRFVEALKPEVERALKVVQGAIIKRIPSGYSKQMRGATVIGVKVLNSSFVGSLEIDKNSPAYSYAPVIEYGRTPGAKQPPWEPGNGYIKSFMDWIRMRVKIAYKETTGTKLGKSKSAEKMFQEAAYLIARAISMRGLPPRYPFKMGFAETQEQAFQIISYGVEKALAAINE